jgi:thioredoxin 1
MTDRILELAEHDFEKSVERGVWVVEYFRPGCAPCHAMLSVLEEIAADHDVNFAKLDVDAAPVFAERAGVASVPTIAILRDGQPVRLLRGPKNRRQILAALEIPDA